MTTSPDTGRRDIALVVDDSPETLRLLTDALDDANMTVMVALDGESAIRIVAQITPDVILLDAVMSGLDGFETCRRLKQDPALAQVPIIFMTGLAETEHIVRGLEAGGVDYVTKPIVVQEMLARIRVHLTNARMTQSARTALDAAGRFLFAVDREGQIAWATPQARNLLADAGALAVAWPHRDELTAWLAGVPLDAPSQDTFRMRTPTEELHVQYISRSGPNEFLLRIQSADPGAKVDLGPELGLTTREAEVLSWLSKGKTNRDIAQILGLSPRTIDKHLEQIYAKLGVENRVAATAVAIQKLGMKNG